MRACMRVCVGVRLCVYMHAAVRCVTRVSKHASRGGQAHTRGVQGFTHAQTQTHKEREEDTHIQNEARVPTELLHKVGIHARERSVGGRKQGHGDHACVYCSVCVEARVGELMVRATGALRPCALFDEASKSVYPPTSGTQMEGGERDVWSSLGLRHHLHGL